MLKKNLEDSTNDNILLHKQLTDAQKETIEIKIEQNKKISGLIEKADNSEKAIDLFKTKI